MNSSLLIHGASPFCFQPVLARAIGLNEAIVLQQLSYLLSNKSNGKLVAGDRWIFNTYEQWRDNFFPWWSVATIQRIFVELEKRAFVVSCQPEGVMSRRKYYRLGAGCLHLTAERIADAEQATKDEDINLSSSASPQFEVLGAANCGLPLTENTSEITAEIHTAAPIGASAIDAACESIYAAYPRKVGKLHAFKAIRKALKDTPADVLLDRVNAFARTVRGKDPQYIPHPATWFNSGRYLDEGGGVVGTYVTPVRVNLGVAE